MHVYVHGVGCSAFTKSAIIAVKSITTHDNVVQGPGNLVAINIFGLVANLRGEL